MFAKKGAAARAAGRVSFTDEQVVYVALAHAIRSGQETVILTKDEDLLEQLYKLLYLVDSHYRSMLIADVYIADFAAFRTHPFPSDAEFTDAFEGANNVLVERSEDLPDTVLPRRFTFVPIHCWLIGERLSTMAFGAEREMQRLIEIKGSTRGKNTTVLGSRNCHLALLPSLPIPPGWGPCFAVAEDKTLELPGTGRHVSLLEFNQAVFPIERFKDYQEWPTSDLLLPPFGSS